MGLGWGVWEDDDDLSDDIIRQSKSDCGHEPENTILVLLTDPSEDDFVNLVGELGRKGVDVYLMSSGATERMALVKAVGNKHWIKLKGIPKAVEDRTHVLVFWDFEYLSPYSVLLPNANTSVREELDRHFPAISSLRFKAFGPQSQMTAALQRLGWELREDDGDLSGEIISQSKSDCGHEPENTIFALMTHPGRDEFADLARELRSKGVEVYLMAPDIMQPCTVGRLGIRSEYLAAPESTMYPRPREVTALAKAVGHEHWIKLTGQVWSQVPYFVPTA